LAVNKRIFPDFGSPPAPTGYAVGRGSHPKILKSYDGLRYRGGSRAFFAPAVGVTPTKEEIMTTAAKISATVPRNTIIHGDCIEVMQTLPARSVDFILTDPPYIAAYKTRDNQMILNDDNAAWLTRSFAQMYRVLKNDACAVSFYGWPKVDLFFAAWKSAGFRIGGHIVFRKRYASKTAFVQYRHEALVAGSRGRAGPIAPMFRC
jgi:hypothetical protein